MSRNRINVSSPEVLVEDSMENLRVVLESGQLAQGNFVKESESLLAKTLAAEHAAMINNGTASLKAAICAGVCAARSIQPEFIDRSMSASEIIVPAFSFNATLNAALQLGGRVRLVDIEPQTFGIDQGQVLDSITDDTLAVIPVDLYGQPADTRRIMSPLENYGIALVRDSAQAHGATIDGQPLTEHGDAVSLSFYATKNVNSGEGGAVLTNNPQVDEITRMYRNQGMKERYQYKMIGDNLRMSELHAAVLITQIGRIAAFKERRQNNARQLSGLLEGIEGIKTPEIGEGMEHVFHQYTVLVEPEFGQSRDELVNSLDERGIGSGIYYPSIMSDHETYQDHPRITVERVEVAKTIARKALSLPIHTKLLPSDLEYIAESIADIQKSGGEG